MLKTLISIVTLTLLSYSSYSQTTYKVKSYELCNLNSSYVQVSCKSFTGTSLYEQFTIDPKFSLSFKFTGKSEIYKSRWEDKNVIQNENGTYTYKMIDEYYNDTKSYFIVLLIFKNDNSLREVFYSLVKDGSPITCKLYFQ